MVPPPPLLYAPGLDPLALGLRTSQPGGEWERMAEGGLGLGPASCCVPLNCLIVSYHDNCLPPPPLFPVLFTGSGNVGYLAQLAGG